MTPASTAQARASRPERAATFFVLFAALLWSTGGLGVKSVELGPMALAGYRSLFAIPVLVLAAWIELRARRLGLREIVRTLRRPWVWAAAVSYAVMVVSFVIAAKLTTAANAILLQYSGPIYVALLSWPLLRERVTWRDGLATLGTLVGMTLFFVDKVSAEGRAGDLVAIVSSLGFAGVPLLMRLEQRAQESAGGGAWAGAVASPLVAMTLGNAIACAVCAPAMLAARPGGALAWSVVALLGTVQIGAAYWLYGAAVGKLPALRSTLLATIEPILNPLWVALVRGERPTRWAMLGGAVIVASVTLQAVARARISGPARAPASRA